MLLNCEQPDSHTQAPVSAYCAIDTIPSVDSIVNTSTMTAMPSSTAKPTPCLLCPTPCLLCRPTARAGRRKALQVKSAAAVEAPPVAAAGRVKLGSSDLQVSGAGLSNLDLWNSPSVRHSLNDVMGRVLSWQHDLGSAKDREGSSPAA